MAAGTAGKLGQKVLILEKNKRIGKKLAITGKGRCNFTNFSEVSEHIRNCPRHGRFLTNALYHFPPQEVMQFFSDLGVKAKIERGNRVFPVSDLAEDIVKALEKYISSSNVKLVFSKVSELNWQADKPEVITIDNQRFRAKAVIIATGGKSYPGTGSTGDGYLFAQKAGHTIIPPKPALVPLETKETWCGKLMGVSLKNIRISIIDKNDQVIHQDFGEMLFTHYGVSGPVILSASSQLEYVNDLILSIDLKPALDEKTLDKRLLREISANTNKQYHNLLKHLLPQKMVELFVELTGIEPERPAHSITKKERKMLLDLLKNLRLSLRRFRPIKEAIITAGGVDTAEIDPRTMQSRLQKNLYFAGEIIDVDAYTGGYNLQIAFSTGHLAACAINQESSDSKN